MSPVRFYFWQFVFKNDTFQLSIENKRLMKSFRNNKVECWRVVSFFLNWLHFCCCCRQKKSRVVVAQSLGAELFLARRAFSRGLLFRECVWEENCLAVRCGDCQAKADLILRSVVTWLKASIDIFAFRWEKHTPCCHARSDLLHLYGGVGSIASSLDR